MKNFLIVNFCKIYFFTFATFFITLTSNLSAQINFSQTNLSLGGLTTVNGVTAMEFGPDSRLYIANYSGNASVSGVIKALTIQRNSPTSYVVTAVEDLNGVSIIPNHNDDGTPAPSFNGRRQVTGLTVVGTADNPVVYVSSSDIRIGGGGGTGEKDSGLDTNSGVITRMTWTGDAWQVVDIVRGLPRSEENHATNGLQFTTINGEDYLIVASGGFTNAGAPSSNFALITEYALAAAVLSVNLTQINQLPILIDNNGRNYIYDIPTLDDPTRPNVNGIIDPDDPGYDGIDVGDPWGGNDGLNQAKIVPGGPVQIFSPGYRNTYDLVITKSGALYVTDNGANGGWGGFPENQGTADVTNEYNPLEPGSTSAINGEIVDNKDHLELVTTDLDNYVFGSFYAGHPNPIRANPAGAGLYTDNKSALGVTGSPIWRTQLYDPDGSRPGSTTNPNVGLPADWPPVPISMANPVEGDWRGPSVANPDGPDDNPIVIWNTNTNGITEYTASNFDNAMKGNLLATHSGGNLHRVQLNPDGTSQQLTQNFLSGIGGFTLGITANSDDEIFPGTIWAGAINGNIVVFEPQDAVECIDPSDPSYDPEADYDLDGYTNQDEVDNGTDPCNGGSQPTDFDKILGPPLISDLNDPDDDGDGIPDALDPMQLGDPLKPGNQAFILPIYNDFFNDQQGLGGIFGLGLTGLMNNGDTGANWLNWLDKRGEGPNPDDVLGGAPGLMTSHMTSGTALGLANNQDKGYQYGVQVSTSTGAFRVTGAMRGFTGELRLYGHTEVIGGELGFQIGDGTQSNYIKFVVTTDGFLALQEINDVPQTPITFNLPESSRPTNEILFHFVVDPADGQVVLEYQIDEGPLETLGTIMAQGSILNAMQEQNSDLIVGLIGTSNTPGVELEGTWDFLNVVPENVSALRINAGGPEISFSGVVFLADQYFNGGQFYTNNEAQVIDLYKTERSSPNKTFSYNIPVENGEYTVNLHFAEIYWGATGGGSGGAGKRIFDVTIEGNLVLDNYDIFADVGAETLVVKSFPVTVSDGELNINFSALATVGGVDQPKLSALEVFGNSIQGIPIIINAIPDQLSAIGEQLDGSLIVEASGGDGNLVYSSLNLPPGLFIDPSNGQIGGTVSEEASVDAPYIVTITVDDSDQNSTNTESIQFQWTVLPAISWNDKNENENYTARHECSFVQAGDKFYLMGGRENARTVDVYDYTTDTWASLNNSAPLAFNHFQATEYQGLIWVIGAFKTNSFPTEQPSEYIWMFDSATNEWLQGPLIPINRRRGSTGLSVYNDKFYISGGNTNGHNGGYVSWFDEFDPATGIWTPLEDAPRARDHFHSAVIGDKLYLAGGRLSGGDGGVFKPVIPEVDVYDFSTSTWSTLSHDLPTPRAGASVVQFKRKLLVIGGEVENEGVYRDVINDALNITEEYNPLEGTWSRIADLNFKRHGTQAFVSGNGVYTIAGSPNLGGGNQKNMEYFGVDSPVGVASIASEISVPSILQFNVNTIKNIPITIANGNTGVYIRSIELVGQDMDKFNILSGNLSNAILKANSEHVIVVEYNGFNAGETANLVINYGLNRQEIIVLQTSFALNVNAGGPQILNNGEVFLADQYFSGGQTYTNNSAQVPDLYKTERSSPSQTFSYNIPILNGDYIVNLHFAEIFWGATGGGAGGVGQRIFDVSIEGDLVLDNYDINADVGPQTVVIKSFPVTVNDGELNIDFSALPAMGGVNQPKVSAISISEPITYSYDGTWTPSDPNGVATSVTDLNIVSGDAIIFTNTNTKRVTVNPGAGLIINSGATLISERLTLESVSNSYSSLILDGDFIGDIYYKRFVNVIGTGTTGGNDLVTPPLNGQRFDDFAADENNVGILAASGTLRAFAPFDNGANPGVYRNYDIVADADKILQAGQGFRAATLNGSPLTFRGTVNTNNVNIDITSETGSFGRWNLIGNPYPSYIRISDFLNHEENSGVKNIQLFANAGGIYGYDGDASDGWDVITLANAGSRLMAPGQGFFVAASSAASIQFTPAMRTSGSDDDFILGRNAGLTFIKLKASTASRSYSTDIYFNDNASRGLDAGYDAQVWGGVTSNFILYSHLVEDNTGLPIALQAIGSNDFTDLNIPLGINSVAGQQVRFSLAENNLPNAIDVYLDDTVANTVTLLNANDYIFTPNSNLNGTGRFFLRFTNNALSVNDNQLDNIKIYTNYADKAIVVNARLEEPSNFELYDTQGRLVRETKLTTNSINQAVDVSDIASGIYVVKIRNSFQFKTQKIILK